MNEQDLLYQALESPLGLVVRGSLQRFQRARSELMKRDHLMRELRLLGPDASGQLWLLREGEAVRRALAEASAVETENGRKTNGT